MAKRKTKQKEKKPEFAKPDIKWYKSMKIWFGIFLVLVLFRFSLFFISNGEIQTNDIWLRVLMITFGTLLAWWYVKRRDKEN